MSRNKYSATPQLTQTHLDAKEEGATESEHPHGKVLGINFEQEHGLLIVHQANHGVEKNGCGPNQRELRGGKKKTQQEDYVQSKHFFLFKQILIFNLRPHNF